MFTTKFFFWENFECLLNYLMKVSFFKLKCIFLVYHNNKKILIKRTIGVKVDYSFKLKYTKIYVIRKSHFVFLFFLKNFKIFIFFSTLSGVIGERRKKIHII